jgi:hypothetical protein
VATQQRLHTLEGVSVEKRRLFALVDLVFVAFLDARGRLSGLL